MRCKLRGCAVLLALVLGCAHAERSGPPSLPTLRTEGKVSTDRELVESWFIAELLREGGSVQELEKARRRLEELETRTMRGEFARALDAHFHGRLRAACTHYLEAARLAQKDDASPALSQLYGWAAIHAAVDLEINDPTLFARFQPWVEESLNRPGQLGWRARGELVEWWTRKARRTDQKEVLKRSTKAFGCVPHLRFAGPFGHNAERDVLRSFEAERPGPWPMRFSPESGIHVVPRVLAGKPRGCFVDATPKLEAEGAVAPPSGIYYVETFLTVPETRELVIAVQGAYALWIDDQQVLERDPRQWGIWPSFGVKARLETGRHRVLARIGNPSSSVRVLSADGTPANLATSADPGPGYATIPPRELSDPNALNRFIREDNRLPFSSELDRLVVAQIAEIEGQADVANVVLEPLLAHPEKATGTALLAAARFTDKDPLFEPNQTRDLVRALHEQAHRRDPGLWEARLALTLFQGEQSGMKDAVPLLDRLSREFPEVPGMLGALAEITRRLGWRAEYAEIMQRLQQSFPDDPNTLSLLVDHFDETGRFAEAEKLVARLLEIDPDNEILLGRALAREDTKTALRELERLGARRPERKDIAERIAEVMLRAGNEPDAWNKFAAILANNQGDTAARLGQADARLARGQRDALRRAIVDAVQAGVGTAELKEALEVLEGETELSAYRMDARTIISEFEQSGRNLPGTAARILDYAAYWIHADGSSRMLEHEVVRVQSAEAVRDFAEYRPPEGLILELRVIKSDGTVIEPEPVPGKPTVTMPHLDIGDYIETEVVMSFEGDGQHGSSYLGPTWFFQEEKLAYDRSELVIISPEFRPLAIEARGDAPEPTIERRDGLVIHRWKVTGSPAASSEFLQPSAREVLPNVRVGWGARLDLQLRGLADATTVLTPTDPRIVRLARRVVEGAPKNILARAARIYHWVLDNVEEGPEQDGRRVVMGKRGNRWRAFVELCRALQIPTQFAVAQNLLLPPPAGPFDEAFRFSEPVLKVGGAGESRFVVLGDKFTPFGYLPAEIRGTQGYLLTKDAPQPTTIVTHGPTDRFEITGRGTVDREGDATLTLRQRFEGKLAIVLRGVLAEAPDAQLRAFVEGRLLGQSLKGAQLLDFEFKNRDLVEQPLLLETRMRVPRFAQKTESGLLISPPFTPNLRSLASIPERETPLVLAEDSEHRLRIELELPAGAKLGSKLITRDTSHDQMAVKISDRFSDKTLVLERFTRIPLGRIAVKDYKAFATFARDAGDALEAQLAVSLTSKTR